MYTECLKCQKLGVSCDGPNFVAMTAPQLVEWCKQRKTTLGLTNPKLAELTGIPVGTINRLFAGAIMDFKHETLRPIMQVLVGGDLSGNPCPNPDDHTAEVEALKARIKELEEAHTKDVENAKVLEETHRKEVEKLKADEHRRIDRLEKEVDYLKGTIKFKNVFLVIFSIALIITLSLIIGFLLYDFTHPDWGVFWLANK